MLKKSMPAGVPIYLTCGEVDRAYRMRTGTARAACDAGTIPCAERSARGRRTYLIRLADAERMWGAR